MLTRFERRLGALECAGAGSALTGSDALDVHGLRSRGLRRSERVPVVVPHTSQKGSHSFAVLTRSRREVESSVELGLRVVPPARAVVDACRREEQRQRVVVLSGRSTISVLPSEVDDDAEGICREVLQFLRLCATEKAKTAS